MQNRIGSEWITDLYKLKQIEKFLHDEEFQKEFYDVKLANKRKLAKIIKDTNWVDIDPNSMFDVQIKRIHEYKRQLLNVMHIVYQYLEILDGRPPEVAKTYIFAGKAAPGYWIAKQIIKLINNVAQVVNNDVKSKDYLKVVFIPDYRVSLAEKIIPAAELSEQISTAGKEASGTGNMKFAMNGALTIGTLDGANIEIMEEVGLENIFIFGLNIKQVQEMRQHGSYSAYSYHQKSPVIRRVMDALSSDMFCYNEPGIFSWISENIFEKGDEYFHLADLESYIEAHKRVMHLYKNRKAWIQKMILNVARIGKFSSDRTILEYARDIWNIKPII